ncbi:MAG: tetratricopeptide repeat protein [Myxococcota bacterium]
MSNTGRSHNLPALSEQEELALERLRRQLKSDPRSHAFVPLAELLRRHACYDEAIQVCLKGLSHHPDYGTGLIALARTHREKGDAEAALEAYRRALAHLPPGALVRHEAAELAEQAGRFEDARLHLQVLYRESPSPTMAARLERVEAALRSHNILAQFEMSQEDDALPDYASLQRAGELRRTQQLLLEWLSLMSRAHAATE